MTEYQTLGHMAPAPEAGRYFIPHHTVLKFDGDLSKYALFSTLLSYIRQVVR